MSNLIYGQRIVVLQKGKVVGQGYRFFNGGWRHIFALTPEGDDLPEGDYHVSLVDDEIIPMQSTEKIQ